MAKITRATQKIFGSNAGPSQLGVFGSLAAGSPAYSNNPVTIQSLSNYLDGWYSAVVGENSPAIQDMNSLCFLYAYQLTYLMQQGIPEWDSATTYYVGSLAQDGSGNVYVSTQNSNLNNALSSLSFWTPQNANINIQTVTTTGLTLSSVSQFARVALSGSGTVILPASASVALGTSITVKNVASGVTVQVLGAGSDTIDGVNTYATTLVTFDSATFIYSGSSNWDVV